jgi:hypothetical protein
MMDTESLEIISLISEHIGISLEDAAVCFRNIPIPAFGNKTAKQMVLFGEGLAVRKYIEHVRTGGYA